MKKSDILFFLHIPKTAGTSFYSMLTQQFFPDNTLIIDDQSIGKFYDNRYPDEFSNYKFFRQHSDYYFYRHLPRIPYILTFLRNPVSRIVSLYNHILNRPDHPFNRFIGQDKSLNSFVSAMKSRNSHNGQIKAIVGRHPRYTNLSDKDYIEIAKIRLNEIAFCGIQEQYSKSMKLLSYIFGWKDIEELDINKSKVLISVPELTTTDRNAIEEYNQLDIEFYNYALNDFQKKINAIDNEIL